MNKSYLTKAAKYFMVSILSTVLFVSQGGCENRSRTEVVGFPHSFADLADKVKPAVVNISTTSIVTVPGNPFQHFFGPENQGPLGDFFKKFFQNMPDRKMKQQSLGSGFVIDKAGFILTNNHVVENAEDIRVRLADGREFKAKVIGRDSKTDLALIKITSTFGSLPVLVLGDSDSMRVGDWVLAVGNPFGLGQTVTQGIISATGRVIGAGPYDDFLQTDAPINPGNSGGPLVNLMGQVIGINTAIISGGQGLGFAIPSNIAKSVAEQLRTKGKVVRGWLGVTIQTVTPEIAKSFAIKEPRGALVSEVAPGGPADKAGIKQGDIIVSFDGKTVKTANDLPYMVAETPVGKTVPVTVLRNGKEINLNVRIEEMTEQRMAEEMQAPSQTFGMTLNNLTPQVRSESGISDTTGVAVVDVQAGSIADQAGIRPGDVIKEVNHHPVKDMRDFDASMKKAVKGQPVLFLVKRKKQVFFVTLESSE
jgi:serine protease Do